MSTRRRSQPRAHRARHRAATNAAYGLYPDGCVAIKLCDDRGDWWTASVSWEVFERMHQEMTHERAISDRRLGADDAHNHEGRLA